MSYREVMVSACDVERRSHSVASQLFGLAKKCTSVDEFLAGCEDAEGYITSDQAGSNKWEHDILPRVWINTKSNIAAGMNAGLSPNQYSSEKAFRTAKSEHYKALKGVPNEGPEREPDTNPEPKGTEVLADLPMIPDDLREMIKYLKVLPELTRAKCVKGLTKSAKLAHDQHLANLKKGGRTMPKQVAVSQ